MQLAVLESAQAPQAVAPVTPCVRSQRWYAYQSVSAVLPSPRRASVVGLQDALGREQRHLGVVGDRPDPAVRLGRIDDARRPEPAPDRRETVELDGGAESVAYSAAEKAAAIAVAFVDGSRVKHACSLVVGASLALAGKALVAATIACMSRADQNSVLRGTLGTGWR